MTVTSEWALILGGLSMISGSLVAMVVNGGRILIILLLMEAWNLGCWLMMCSLFVGGSGGSPALLVVGMALFACETAVGLSVLFCCVGASGNEFVRGVCISGF